MFTQSKHNKKGVNAHPLIILAKKTEKSKADFIRKFKLFFSLTNL